MPKIADNIPAALQAILEDRNFIDQESAAVRAILEAPADPSRRYAAGKMYESFGLLCPALQAYHQTLVLQPDHDKAAKRATRLESENVSPDDEEGVYQLPPLGSLSQISQPAATESNAIGIIRMGYIAKPQEWQLKRGMHDGNWLVTNATSDQLSLKSRDSRIVMLAVSGVLALLGFVGWVVWLFIQQASSYESLGNPSRMTAEALGLLAFGIVAVAGLRFLRKVITVHGDGRLAEQSRSRQLKYRQLQKGSRVRLDLEYRLGNSERQCLVSLIDENNTVVKDIGMAPLEKPDALFQVRLAASLAALFDVPLEIAGSARFDHPNLTALLCKLSDAMQPSHCGGPA